jgi:hypothetical protein
VKPETGYGPGGPRFGTAGQRFSRLEQVLGDNLRLQDTDLEGGQVPAEADLLLVLAPDKLGDKQRFAIDQFLMQGGSVVLATSLFDVQFTGTLSASLHESGREDWLSHHGLGIGKTMVLTPTHHQPRRNLGRLPGGNVACRKPSCHASSNARAFGGDPSAFGDSRRANTPGERPASQGGSVRSASWLNDAALL